MNAVTRLLEGYDPAKADTEELHFPGVRKLLVETLDGELVILRLIVEPSRRGQGYGAAAVKGVIALARERGLKAVRLTADPEKGREADLARFYARLGFVPDEWGCGDHELVYWI